MVRPSLNEVTPPRFIDVSPDETTFGEELWASWGVYGSSQVPGVMSKTKRKLDEIACIVLIFARNSLIFFRIGISNDDPG